MAPWSIPSKSYSPTVSSEPVTSVGSPPSHRGQVLAGVADDAGVGRVLDRARVAHQRCVGEVHDIAEPGVDGMPEVDLGAESPRSDPTVAVRRPASVEGDAMQHAVAIEHVVAADRLEHRVGSVAHERST